MNQNVEMCWFRNNTAEVRDEGVSLFAKHVVGRQQPRRVHALQGTSVGELTGENFCNARR